MADLTRLDWTSEHDVELGARITTARQAAGVSLQTLADFLAVSKATAGHWETGERTIKHHDLARLCAALKVSADQLLFGRAVWPFSAVDAHKVESLESQDLHKLEGAILLTAAQVGLDVSKPPPLRQPFRKTALLPGVGADLDHAMSQQPEEDGRSPQLLGGNQPSEGGEKWQLPKQGRVSNNPGAGASPIYQSPKGKQVQKAKKK